MFATGFRWLFCRRFHSGGTGMVPGGRFGCVFLFLSAALFCRTHAVGQSASVGEWTHLFDRSILAVGQGSWRSVRQWHLLSRQPDIDQAHGTTTTWTADWFVGWRFGCDRFRVGWRVPCLLFLRREQWFFAEQCTHPVAAHFGGGMQPAEGSDASKTGGEDVLEVAPHPFHGLEFQ